MLRNRWMRWMLAGVLLVACGGGPAQGQILQSTFDAGLEGWTGSPGGEVTYSATGGRPGGHLQQTDLDFTDMFVIAPADFLGDRSAFLGGVISFDGRQVIGASDYAPFGTVTLRSGGLAVSADIAPANHPTSDWNTYAAALDAATFSAFPEAFAQIMGNLTAIEVTLESQSGIVETTGFDNFRMAPAAAPEPASLLLSCFAFAGATSCCWARRLRKRGD